ncbi:MAG TPA: nitrogen fixation protein NifX [Polyangiaceae bacterium]
MRVAFASSDGRAIDQHFGTARRFDIWELSAQGARCVERIVTDGECNQKDARIAARAMALDGCAIVYATELGGPAAAKLVGRNIQPLKAPHATLVAAVVAALQRVLSRDPPPWLRKVEGLPMKTPRSSASRAETPPDADS